MKEGDIISTEDVGFVYLRTCMLGAGAMSQQLRVHTALEGAWVHTSAPASGAHNPLYLQLLLASALVCIPTCRYITTHS